MGLLDDAIREHLELKRRSGADPAEVAAQEREVLGADRSVVVDFWAPWCGPCKSVERVFNELEAEHGAVLFARVNVDENAAAAARYGVLSLPTAIVFEGGEARSTVVGARSRSHYEQEWERWLSGSDPSL
jgi:thioredoxin 1